MTKQYTSSGYKTNLVSVDGTETALNYHWGILLEAQEPTTGVYNGNDIEWDGMPYEWIDLYYEEAVDEIMERDDLDDEEKDDAVEELSNCFDSGDTLLYGSWKKVDGQYEADRDTEDPEDFAAIYNANYNTLQVVWSKVVKFGLLASPCYPGQVSANTDDGDEGQQSYYALPDVFVYTQEQHDKDLEQMKMLAAKREAQELIDNAAFENDAKGLSEV